MDFFDDMDKSLNEKPKKKESLIGFIRQYNRKTKFIISLSALGLILFLSLVSIAPFRDKLLSSLYPKQKSQAQSIFPTPTPFVGVDNRFAVAGQAQGAELGSLYYYEWGNTPPTKSQTSSTHKFAWMVGKLDRSHNPSDGPDLSCGSIEVPCNLSRITAIYELEKPYITNLLANTVNKGGVWIIGNEANFYPTQSSVQYPNDWHSHIDAGLYAIQYKMYRDLIKRLDPAAKIAHSGLLYDNRAGRPLADDPVAYLNTFLNKLPQSEWPDIYNVHFYPDPGKDASNNIAQAKAFKDNLTFKDLGKPIWVTEFGMISASEATLTEAKNYMNSMITAFADNYLANRWFWFIGRDEPDWTQTALTSNGQLTLLGQHYLESLKPPSCGGFVNAPCPAGYTCQVSSNSTLGICVPSGDIQLSEFSGTYNIGSQAQISDKIQF
ncbi:hypothetical protein HYU95_03060 [Candidatus Daviesbacteria bacterium]|nr:hypothetical protein [Candidatus Daviesbacteria bacterium]